MHSSCCEGQGTRMFGSLAEYLYMLATAPATGAADAPATRTGSLPAAERLATPAGPIATAVYVDIYAASTISFAVAAGTATLTQVTAWPYGESVSIVVSLPAAGPLDIALRMPSWLAPGTAVTVTVGGKAWPVLGSPGSYLHVDGGAGGWPAGPSTLSFSLPMPLVAYQYTGLSVLPPFSRWGFMVGPVLLAAQVRSTMMGWGASAARGAGAFDDDV